MADLRKKRIGVHVGTAGGVWTAVDRAVAAGANAFQIFSASPRMWKAAPVKAADAAKMLELRAEFLVLHPGSWKGLTREQGLTLAAESIERAVAGIDFAGKNFKILIENT